MPEPKARLRGVRSIIRDAIGLLGAGSITYGVYSFSHPAGFIVGGALAIAWTAFDVWASG